MADQIDTCEAKGYANGFAVGATAFKKTVEYEQMLNLNYISTYYEMLELMKEGKSVEKARAYIRGRASNLQVEPIDDDDLGEAGEAVGDADVGGPGEGEGQSFQTSGQGGGAK